MAKRRFAKGYRVSFVVLAALLTGGAAASCSLDLGDSWLAPKAESEIEAGADATTPAEPRFVPDALADALPDVVTPARECIVDADCKSTHECLSGACDPTAHVCTYDICKAATACQSATCDESARTCGAPAPHGFRIGSFPVGAGVGCGGAVGRCFAVVYPYVFVGTPVGALAFRVPDSGDKAATGVPLTGLGFLPTSVVASGNRVYFLGTSVNIGAVAESRVPLAWLDVPSDPFVDKLTVTNVLATINRAVSTNLRILPRADGTVLLFEQNSAASYPMTTLMAPLVEPLNLVTTPVPFTSGSLPVATSGSRAIFMSATSQSSPTASFVTGAGGGSPQNTGDVSLAGAAAVATGLQAFAVNASGSVFWSYPQVTVADASVPTVRAARGTFLVSGNTANFDTTSSFDIETYTGGAPVPGATTVVGPAAVLDADAVLVTAATPTNLSQTSVQVAKLAPLGIVKNGETPRRHVLAAPPNLLAASASHGRGYVLVSESTTTSSVHVFDPGCDP